jgi:MoaA/NifB/PqqE/SkfB family radical SAM enzyme
MTIAETDSEVSVRNCLRFLWLEITAKCNLLCSHCYAESGPDVDLFGTMTHGDWKRVVDEAAELGCRSVQFIGGEPTLHPRLPDLVDHANHRGFEFIEVYTNATRLGKKLLGCFQRGGVHVATSFYSDDPLVHEQITQVEGSWQRTVLGIESVLAAGLPIRVGVIETARNPGHGARALELLKTLGVQNARIDRERGVGRGKLQHLACEGERYEELCGECWKDKLCVTSGGEVFPCVFARATRLGDVRPGLSGVLQSAQLTEFRRKVRALGHADPRCHPADGNAGDSAREVIGQQCNPLATCNPDTCNPNGCNPLDCNPLGSNCNPCNPCGPA